MMDASAALRSRAEALDEPAGNGWNERRGTAHRPAATLPGRRIAKLNYEDVAEFSYQPGKCGRVRKNISKSSRSQKSMRCAQAQAGPERKLFYR